MFGFSMGEMLFILALALIFIGPKQMPEVARSIGKLLNEIKRAGGDFQKSFTEVRDDASSPFRDARSSLNDAVNVVRAPPAGTVSQTPAPAVVEDITAGYTGGPSGHADVDPQQSLFVPTDLSGVEPVAPAGPPPSEEQLSFKLTSFDDEGHS